MTSSSQEPESSIALIPLPGDSSRFLSLGDISALPVLESEPTTLLSQQSIASVAEAITMGLNAPLQLANGLQQGSHLVRLAPETVSALKNGAEFTTIGGKLSGSLRGADGRIVHIARFTSVSSALSAAASVGMALTMVAIQLQLGAISRKLDALSSQLDRVDESLRNERLSEIESLSMAVQHSLEQSTSAGIVPDKVMASISGKSQVIDAHIRRLEKDVLGRLSRVPTKGKAGDQMKWLADDGLAGVTDLYQLLVAIQGWLIHQGLYAANLGNSGASAELAAQRKVIEQTAARHDELENLVGDLAYEINRVLYLAEKAPGKIPKTESTIRLIDRNSASTSERVRETAKQLRDALKAADVPLRDVPTLPATPRIGNMPSQTVRVWKEMLRYQLRSDETPLLYIEGRGVGGKHNKSKSSSVMVFTNQRVLGIRKKNFAEDGVFAFDFERREIQEVLVKGNRIGRIPAPGKVLRLEVNGRSVDMELCDSDDAFNARICRAAKAALAEHRPPHVEGHVIRPRQIEGIPIL